MKEMYKYLFAILLYITTVSDLLAQVENPFELNVPSPNSIAIAKYGDIPMSLYTGAAQISVPIYSTNQKGVPLNVDLFYDTSGMRARSLPGWIGYGWSLNAGGVITRVEKNGIDELDYQTILGHPTDWKNYFANPSKIIDSISEYKNKRDMHKLVYDRLALGDYDYTPDVFYFNFMGKSGRFFYGNDAQWHVLSDANLKVELELMPLPIYVHISQKNRPLLMVIRKSHNPRQLKDSLS